MVYHNINLLLIPLAIALVALVSSAVVENELSLKQFRYLGSFNEKSYMLEENSRMNWTEAWNYCKEYDMTLATVESKEERDFLRNAFSNANFNITRTFHYFWLDAQEYSEIYSAGWVDNANAITVNVQLRLRPNLPPTSTDRNFCGYAYVRLLDNGTVYATENGAKCGDNYLHGLICNIKI